MAFGMEANVTTHLTLPANVHEHFRKANVLHGYVQKNMGEAAKHALETGKELLAAKQTIPHGSWESECERLFDGSVRTAQSYMQFAKHVESLPKAQSSAVLMLESSLSGAAKEAKRLAAPTPPKPPRAGPSQPSTNHNKPGAQPTPTGSANPPANSPVKQDYGKCPNCAGTKWDEDEDGVSCVKCHHPHGEPLGDVDDDRLKTQRQKTVKTVEALMRAFDDLQVMLGRKALHDESISACKRLLTIAKGWK